MNSTEISTISSGSGYLHDLFTLPPFLGKKIYAIGTYEFAKMYGFPLQSGISERR